VIVLVAGIAALLVGGIGLARIGSASGSRATGAVRAMIWAFALLIADEAALGACGALDAKNTLLGLAGAAIAIAAWARRRPVRPEDRRTREIWSVADVALAAGIGAALALRLWAGLHKSVFLYDALSYHLHVPVTWLHARRLEIVPAVFGDPAPAYAPSNVELWFLFLLAPLRSDYLAGAGQLPFAALAVLAVAATVREAGGRRTAALGAGLAFLLVPEIWQQAPTAMTDLALAALLLASLPFAVRLYRSRAMADALASTVALALAVGSKYVGPVLALPFAVVALATLAGGTPGRPRASDRSTAMRAVLVILVVSILLVVFFAAGGFWYLRNAIVTGNPFYPVRALGLPGLYGRAAMRAWDYHLPVGDLGALGAMLMAGGAAFTGAAALGLLRSRPRLELALAVALGALFWGAVPYQESRFSFAVFGVAAVAVGRATAAPPALLGWGALALAIGGELLEFPTPERLALLPAGALGAAAALAYRRLAPRARRAAGVAGAIGVVVGLCGGVVAVAVGLERYRAGAPGYAIGEEIDGAWAWMNAQVRDARVAYAGTNLAFPLAGRDLGNRVTYVNVAGLPGDRLDDFARRKVPAAADVTTPEPAPYRAGAAFETWLRNLRAARAEVLFVAAMYPIVERSTAGDPDGFPVERAWADAHPALFSLRYATPAARIYGIAAP
jgi:hypothetical protein